MTEHETDALTQVSKDIESLQQWAHTHDNAHVTDDDRLNIILETVTKHNTNHHGTKSRVRESGLTALALAAVAALGELLGFWELLSRFF